MSNTKQHQNHNTNINNFSNTISGWDEAIARVESEIYRMDNYVKRLKAAKDVFLRSKDEGLKWPGSVKAMIDEFKEGVTLQEKSPRRAGAA